MYGAFPNVNLKFDSAAHQAAKTTVICLEVFLM